MSRLTLPPSLIPAPIATNVPSVVDAEGIRHSLTNEPAWAIKIANEIQNTDKAPGTALLSALQGVGTGELKVLGNAAQAALNANAYAAPYLFPGFKRPLEAAANKAQILTKEGEKAANAANIELLRRAGIPLTQQKKSYSIYKQTKPIGSIIPALIGSAALPEMDAGVAAKLINTAYWAFTGAANNPQHLKEGLAVGGLSGGGVGLLAKGLGKVAMKLHAMKAVNKITRGLVDMVLKADSPIAGYQELQGLAGGLEPAQKDLAIALKRGDTATVAKIHQQIRTINAAQILLQQVDELTAATKKAGIVAGKTVKGAKAVKDPGKALALSLSVRNLRLMTRHAALRAQAQEAMSGLPGADATKVSKALAHSQGRASHEATIQVLNEAAAKLPPQLPQALYSALGRTNLGSDNVVQDLSKSISALAGEHAKLPKDTLFAHFLNEQKARMQAGRNIISDIKKTEGLPASIDKEKRLAILHIQAKRVAQQIKSDANYTTLQKELEDSGTLSKEDVSALITSLQDQANQTAERGDARAILGAVGRIQPQSAAGEADNTDMIAKLEAGVKGLNPKNAGVAKILADIATLKRKQTTSLGNLNLARLSLGSGSPAQVNAATTIQDAMTRLAAQQNSPVAASLKKANNFYKGSVIPILKIPISPQLGLGQNELANSNFDRLTNYMAKDPLAAQNTMNTLGKSGTTHFANSYLPTIAAQAAKNVNPQEKLAELLQSDPILKKLLEGPNYEAVAKVIDANPAIVTPKALWQVKQDLTNALPHILDKAPSEVGYVDSVISSINVALQKAAKGTAGMKKLNNVLSYEKANIQPLKLFGSLRAEKDILNNPLENTLNNVLTVANKGRGAAETVYAALTSRERELVQSYIIGKIWTQSLGPKGLPDLVKFRNALIHPLHTEAGTASESLLNGAGFSRSFMDVFTNNKTNAAFKGIVNLMSSKGISKLMAHPYGHAAHLFILYEIIKSLGRGEVKDASTTAAAMGIAGGLMHLARGTGKLKGFTIAASSLKAGSPEMDALSAKVYTFLQNMRYTGAIGAAAGSSTLPEPRGVPFPAEQERTFEETIRNLHKGSSTAMSDNLQRLLNAIKPPDSG